MYFEEIDLTKLSNESYVTEKLTDLDDIYKLVAHIEDFYDKAKRKCQNCGIKVLHKDELIWQEKAVIGTYEFLIRVK